jgi:diaminopimelate decarboxylase
MMSHIPHNDIIYKCADELHKTEGHALCREYEMRIVTKVLSFAVDNCGYAEPDVLEAARTAAYELKKYYETLNESGVSLINQIGGLGMRYRDNAQELELEVNNLKEKVRRLNCELEDSRNVVDDQESIIERMKRDYEEASRLKR